MPDAPVSLLDQGGGDRPGFLERFGQGLTSLLAPIVSGGYVGPNDPAATPALLAFGARLAQMGAPTLGPPTPLLNAIPQAMGAAGSAAVQQHMLPLLQAQAEREAEAQRLAIAGQAFQLNRDAWLFKQQQDAIRQMSGQGDGTGAPAPGAPAATPGGPAGGGGTAAGETAGTQEQIAALPDVQSLPDESRVPFIQTMVKIGAGPELAANYARVVHHESGGLMLDPKTGQVLTSPKGAQGVAQVMPGTFDEMAKKYNIQGASTDLMANLEAGARYFQEGWLSGNPTEAAIRYNAGPKGLETFRNTQQLPAETSDYLARVKPTIRSVQVAGPGAPTDSTGASGAAPAAGGPQPTNTQPMVFDQRTGQTIPLGIQQAAHAAFLAAAAKDPASAPAAYTQVIEKYQLQRAAEGTFTTVRPGVQERSTTGQQSESPMGPTIERPATEAEIAGFPNKQPGVDYSAVVYTQGPMAGQVKEFKVLNPRGTGLAFQSTTAIQKELQDQPTYTNWQNAATRYDNVFTGLNQRTRVGDKQAIESYAKVIDPNPVVPPGSMDEAQWFAGLPGVLQGYAAKLAGGASLTDDTRRDLAAAVNEDMAARDRAMLQQIEQHRAYAGGFRNIGVDPDNIMPSFRTYALSKDDAGEYGGLKGVTYRGPFTETTNSKGELIFRRQQPGQAATQGQPPQAGPQTAPQPVQGGGAVVTPQSPQAAPQPPQGGAQAQPQQRPMLTEAYLHDLSPKEFAALGAAMSKPDAKYQPEDRAAYVKDAQRRGLMK